MKKVDFLRNFRTRFNHNDNRGGSVKLTAKMNVKIRRRDDPVFARKFVTWGVAISTVMVGVSLFVTVYYNPEAVAERKFAELAKVYYEDYYYDRFVESVEPELFEEKMAKSTDTGFQPVLLRQLLLYQNGKYASYRKYFEREGFSCDKNKMSATFYPQAPFGRTDYKVEYNVACANE